MDITAEKIILALEEIEHLQEKFVAQLPGELEWAQARLEATQFILKIVRDESLLEAYAEHAEKRQEVPEHTHDLQPYGTYGKYRCTICGGNTFTKYDWWKVQGEPKLEVEG